MKKFRSVLLWVLLALLLAAAAGGGYYILKIKPLEEARKTYREAAEAYENAYADYEKAIAAYNAKTDQCAEAGTGLRDAHQALEELIGSDEPYSEAMVEEAQRLMQSQKKKLTALPEHLAPLEKAELLYEPDEEGAVSGDTVTGTEAEIAFAAQRLTRETQKILEETAAVEEMTEELKIPDFSAEIAEVTALGEKIADSVYDPFENLIISFAGTEPNGTVTIEKKSNTGINGTYEFSVEESTKLCNGDQVTVTVKPEQNKEPEAFNEELLGTYGKALTAFEKTFTVDGLSYYLSGVEELSADAFAKMQAKAEESLAAYAEKNWKGDVTVSEMNYLGNYFLDRKATNQGFFQESAKNQIVLLYRVKCRIDLAGRGKEYAQDVDYIYTVTYKNVINLADGTCAVDYDAYSEPEETFKIDTGVKANLVSKYKFTFKGYKDEDAAFNRIIAEQSEYYTYNVQMEDGGNEP